MNLNKLGQTNRRDFGNIILGKKLGEGAFRKVYELNFCPDKIIKLESKYASFHNVREWEAWRIVMGTEHEKWFAPCYDISGCGGWLVMARTTPVVELPEKVPVYLNDISVHNFGMFDGRVVCHDYGCNLLTQKGLTKKMRKSSEVWV